MGKINGEGKHRDLLRFTTAGSVDDGKSTLIGRLLYDSKSIFEDQMEHIRQSSKRLGKKDIDLSLLTDGLRAEREQGITIDVAYRYFATPERKFIIADTPGHIQYTRNMVTGASTADLALILTDARNGVVEQTIRHTYIASLLGIGHVVFCVNKMDLVNYSPEIFSRTVNDLRKLSEKLGIENANFIPISAKYGDNVVEKSTNMTWYTGNTLLRLLETIEIKPTKENGSLRFPVQTVLRPQSNDFHDYRGYSGRVAGGTLKSGAEVIVLPSMQRSRVRSIDIYEKSLDMALAGDSVTITLEDQIDAGRGSLLVDPGNMPAMGQEINLMVCWFNEKPLKQNVKYIVRNCNNETYCHIRTVNYKMNINTLEKDTTNTVLTLNDLANITIKTSKPLFYDSYNQNHITGSLILIDESTNETVAAGMILS